MNGRQRGRRGSLGLLLILLAALILADAAALADAPAVPRIVELRAGFSAQVKLGCWAPYTVVVAAGSASSSGRLAVIAYDDDGTPTRLTIPQEGTLELAAGESREIRLSAKIGQQTRPLEVQWLEGDTPVAARRFTPGEKAFKLIPTDAEWIVIVGGAAGDVGKPWTRKNSVVSRLADPRELPVAWQGYDGVDAFVILGSDPALAAELAKNGDALDALDEWIRRGGRVILSLGVEAPALLAAGAPLARFTPGKFEAMVTLRQGSILEVYAETKIPLQNPSGAPLEFTVPKLIDVQGKIDAFAGNQRRDLPIVVRTPRGFGEIVFLAVDVDRTPLAQWSATPRLIDRLLRRPRTTDGESDAAPAQSGTLGYSDLSGQLRGAMDQFEGVTLAPFWLVAVLISAYILCIGPLDYYLVQRVFKRPEATWLTLAVWVALFGGGAYLLSGKLKGNEPRVNRLDVVDFDARSQFIRGTTWATLLSPHVSQYDLTLRIDAASLAPRTAPPGDTPPSLLFSWFGLPGKGLGGMSASGNELLQFGEAYRYVERESALARVPIGANSSKAFLGRWSSHGPPPIEAELSEGTRGSNRSRLSGTLINRLQSPPAECVLLYDRWAYKIAPATFPPGRTLDLDADLSPQTIDTYLRQVRAQGDKSVAAPYDPSSQDLPRIIEILSTFELAGGQSYTKLSNAYQSWLDLSSHVRDGQAVLLLRTSAPSSQLQVDGASLQDPLGPQTTFYRFVFPVSEGKE